MRAALPHRHVLVLALVTHIVTLTRAVDSCSWSCRYRAAQRLPTSLVPLELARCTTAQHRHCQIRNRTVEQGFSRAVLFVAMTTIPPRSGRSLQRAVDSLYSQQRQPDGCAPPPPGRLLPWPPAAWLLRLRTKRQAALVPARLLSRAFKNARAPVCACARLHLRSSRDARPTERLPHFAVV